METLSHPDPTGPRELSVEEMAALSGGAQPSSALPSAGAYYFPPQPV